MEITRVERFEETNRDELGRMLQRSEDFPLHLDRLHLRSRSSYPTFVAWRGDAIVGLLDGAFNMDFASNREFVEFDLPITPHALVERIYVQPTARRAGVGGLLVAHFAMEAVRHRCLFIGGSLDLTSDVKGRRMFFARQGFAVGRFDTFGALTADVLLTGR